MTKTGCDTAKRGWKVRRMAAGLERMVCELSYGVCVSRAQLSCCTKRTSLFAAVAHFDNFSVTSAAGIEPVTTTFFAATSQSRAVTPATARIHKSAQQTTNSSDVSDGQRLFDASRGNAAFIISDAYL